MPMAARERAEAHSCPLCSGTDWRPLVVAYDRMYARADDYRYVRCRSCGLVALHPLPSAEAVAEFYPADYSPHRLRPKRDADKVINRLAIRYFFGVDSRGHSRLLRWVFRVLSGRIMKGIREPIGATRLLDVGCASGNLLARYRALGWTVRGIETNSRACAVCRQRGLDVHQGTVFDAPFAGAQFDLILLQHVIEHVLDPVGVLARVGELLAPGGTIVVTTPNIDGMGFARYGSCWYALDAPRHLMLFNPTTMRRLGERAGLTVRRVVTRSSPPILCDSRHYARTQGTTLPPDLPRRAEILAASARAKPSRRVYRKLIAPLAAVYTLADRGDVLEADLTRVKLVGTTSQALLDAERGDQ
jgi:2-polyprenyl-3-methyl-5-hydroxy-6-metoxy-1,4-benzoquinol methylase